VRRIVSVAVSLVLVVGIFVYAIPRFADYKDVWATIQDLTPLEFGTLFAAMVFNLFTYWLANMAALPGLRLSRSAVLTQTTTSVANTLPAGGAIAIGLTYSILQSWGFSANQVVLYVGVTGVWNTFTKLGLPVIALALLAIQGALTGPLILGAVFGVAALAVAVGLLAAVFWKEELARRIGDRIGRMVSAFLKLFRRPPVSGWGDRAVRFRADTIELVHRRWVMLTITTVGSHLALWFVLLLSLRHVGISEAEVSTVEVLAVFAFGRLITALPFTPGGLGVIELGYIGGLTAAGGADSQVVAAVLLFRVLTYGIQIPLGGFTYLIWRGMGSWRREGAEPEASVVSSERAAD
jgi:uncharacterized protein (TIRG00374 family)